MPLFFETVLNGLWQGCLLTLLVWLVLRDLPRIGASTRVAIWHVTLLVVLLLPALQRITFTAQELANAPEIQSQSNDLIQPVPLRRIGPGPTAAHFDKPKPLLEISEGSLPGALLGFSMLLAIVQLFRLVLGFWAIRRLKRKGLPSDIAMPVPHARRVNVLISDRIGMPMAVGYRHPAILLPSALADLLTPEEMRYVLLHESAHLRRNDDWIALAERFVRAIFCFHPAVYWIARQIEQDRELACDDWVVAQSGETKPYASALARLSELACSGRVPILAAGSGRRKQIFTRLETLLDRTRNRIPAVSGSLVLLAGIALVFVVSQGTQFNHLLGFSHYSSRWIESDGTHRQEVKLRGTIDFSADGHAVESISPGGKFVLEQSEGWRTRRVELEADEAGNIQRSYILDGTARPFDTEGRRFLAAVLPQWVREQGRNIPETLAVMIHEKGVDAALDEIRTIHGSQVKRGYLEELFAQADLKTEQLHRTLKIAGQMDSDREKRQFLENMYDHYDASYTQVMDFVDTIHSDDDRSKLLNLVIEHGPFDVSALSRLVRTVSRISSDGAKTDLLVRLAQSPGHELPASLFDAASTIHSDGDRERLLSAVLASHGEDAAIVAKVLRAAVTLSSDGDKTKILIASANTAHSAEPDGGETLRETSRVLRSIHSDGDRSRSLEALIQSDGNNAETLREVLLQTAAISSDGDKARVLIQVATAFVEQEPVRRAFFSAVNTIHSSGDQRRILTALLARPGLGKDTLHELTLSASRLPQDDLAAVMRSISERN